MMRAYQFVLCVSALSLPLPAHAVVLSITDVFTSRQDNGVDAPYVPKIGEDYRLTVRYRVVGEVRSDFDIAFEMAGLREEQRVSKASPGEHETTFNFGPLPLDEVIPYRVTLDPHDVAAGGDKPIWPQDRAPIRKPEPGGTIEVESSRKRPQLHARRTLSGTFKPRVPSRPIEYFEPARLRGSQSVYVEVPGGQNVSRIVALMGHPATDSWQELVHSSCKVSATFHGGGGMVDDISPQPVSASRYWPFYYWDRSGGPIHQFSMKHDFTVRVSNPRVNADLLRKATWAQVDALQGIPVFKHFTEPDSVTESRSSTITSFVRETLGPTYRSTTTPYDAARKIFQAILARVEYTYPEAGEPDLRGHTAVAVLEGGLGDCGGFSLLIVAALRNMGLPARTACGFWTGAASHCWAEFFLPGAGWVLCDGSAGNAYSETGEYAYCFGNMNDLNRRMALMRGNTFAAGSVRTAWIPYLEVPGAQTYDVSWKSVVERVGTGRSGRVAGPAATRCPCTRHGGIEIDRGDLRFRRAPHR